MEALCQMLVCDWAPNSDTSACTSVIRALRSWFATVGIETEWDLWSLPNFAWFHKSVLLFNAVPWIMLLVLLMDLQARCPRVPNRWLVTPRIIRVRQHHHMWV